MRLDKDEIGDQMDAQCASAPLALLNQKVTQLASCNTSEPSLECAAALA